MREFISLIKVEFKRIFSNRVLVAILIGAPIFYGILLGTVYQGAKVIDLPIILWIKIIVQQLIR